MPAFRSSLPLASRAPSQHDAALTYPLPPTHITITRHAMQDVQPYKGDDRLYEPSPTSDDSHTIDKMQKCGGPLAAYERRTSPISSRSCAPITTAANITPDDTPTIDTFVPYTEQRSTICHTIYACNSRLMYIVRLPEKPRPAQPWRAKISQHLRSTLPLLAC